MDERLTPELERKLKTCRSLPSPPSYALQVIDLVNDPEVEMAQAVKVFSQDPVIVSKILRIANSPLYANQRTVENLQMAILMLGLNATTSLALSFSLVSSMRGTDSAATLHHGMYWKRMGLAAAASRVLGKCCAVRDLEELFIAALLQDIGMLALDHVCPELYADQALNQVCHPVVVAHEQQQLGVNHATVGGWLLNQWHLPERLHLAVSYSEAPLTFPPKDERAAFVCCVAASGLLANLLLNEASAQILAETAETLETWLGLPPAQLPDLLQEMTPVINEVEQLFEMNITGAVNPADLIEMAREGQLLQNLKVCQENEQLKTGTINLETQYDQLEHASQRDGLTGVFNRAFLDEYVKKAFQQAQRDGHPISLGFVDLDHFKSVNDTFGHAIGDQVLKAAAKQVQAQVRISDFVGRYGGEEFVVILPGTPASGAAQVFHRILEAFRGTPQDVGKGQTIIVTASIGISTHSPEHPFPSVQAWIEAADHGVYAAKRKGRDQCAMHEDLPACTGSPPST